MYEKSHNKDGSLKHSPECKMVFGRKDEKCHRCAEMLAGSAPRGGWQNNFYDKKKQDADIEKSASERHHKTCKICNDIEQGVCTYNDC